MLSVPLSLLVKAGLCVPLTPSLAMANEPLNFNEPVAPFNLPVPLTTVAVPVRVTVPAESSGADPELFLLRIRKFNVPPAPASLPDPV
jgi:hypothetical protein